MKAKIRVVIVDDHRILRDGLRSLLDRQQDFFVVGEAGDGREALACMEKTVPDVLILDIHLPDETGLQITRKVLSSWPATRIIILSANPDSALVDEALRLGAVGYLCKEEAWNELTRAIQTVMRGQVYLSPVAATSLVANLNTRQAALEHPGKSSFTDRELDVLKLVFEGLRNKEIAGRIGVSVKSVEAYRSRLMSKAGCSSPAELVRFALREKLVVP